MSDEREMTLEEWMARLPDIHLANKEFQLLKQQLAEAVEVIEFYGNKENWLGNGEVGYSDRTLENNKNKTGYLEFGGMKARKFLAKYREENRE